MCLSEADVVRLAQQCDAAAFEYLYKTHSRRVYGICLRVVGNKAEAEELTQNAFSQSFRNMKSFGGESDFSKALLRLTVILVLKRRAARDNPTISDCFVFDLVR